MMKWGKIHKNPFLWKCSWKDGMMGQEDAASTPGAVGQWPRQELLAEMVI